MKKLQETKRIIQKNKPIIQDKFNVKNIGLFGSYARGEQNQGSDVDILVEFSKPIGFFDFMIDSIQEIENFAEIKAVG